MGWIARAQLASRGVSNAGAMGIIETSSGELDVIRDEIRKMRDLTDKPFGVNIAQAFVRDPSIVEFVVEQGVKFVTTSAGSPTKYTGAAEGGRAHRVPRRAEPARRAEGGRRRRRRPHRRGRRGRRVQEPASGVDDGAAAARRVEGRRADHRRRRLRRRADDGRRVRARRRGRADGHAHGVVRRVARPRQLEAGGPRRRRRPTPSSSTGTRRPALRALRTEPHRVARVRQRGERDGAVRQRDGPLLRRRHGGGDRARRARSPAASTRSGPSPRSSTRRRATASRLLRELAERYPDAAPVDA